MLEEYTGWYFQVHERVRILRRESATRGLVGWMPTHWVGSEEGGARGGGGGPARWLYCRPTPAVESAGAPVHRSSLPGGGSIFVLKGM